MSDNKEENLPSIQPFSAFGSIESFESSQRMANLLSSSDIVPEQYRGKLGNCLVALEISQRTKSGVMAVMQNLHIIKGRPSWSSAYIIAAINTCGRFNELEFDITDKGEAEVEYEITNWVGPKGHATKKVEVVKEKVHNYECYAYTTSKRTGKILKGTTVSIKMAVAEGWYGKDGSKWQTMPELMLQYRAAAFFGRVYAPELLMGMQTKEEIEDFVGPDNAKDVTPPKRSATAEEIQKEFIEPAKEVVAEVLSKTNSVPKAFIFNSASEQPGIDRPLAPSERQADLKQPAFTRSWKDEEFPGDAVKREQEAKNNG